MRKVRLHIPAICKVFPAFLYITGCAATAGAPPPKPTPAADPRICADIEPAPPLKGGIPQPVTQEQRDAVAEFFRGSAELWGWGNRGWFRAGLAKDQFCPK